MFIIAKEREKERKKWRMEKERKYKYLAFGCVNSSLDVSDLDTQLLLICIIKAVKVCRAFKLL